MILHAYGDSWTEGQGFNLDIEKKLELKDASNLHTSSNYKNSELNTLRKNKSWVKSLANKLDIQFINNGKISNPNSVIFNSIIDDITNDIIKIDDFVIVMWSSSLRDYTPFLPKNQWISWSVKHLINLPNKFINSYKSDNEKYDSFLREYKLFFLDNLFNQNYYNIVNQNYIIFLQKLFEFYGIKYLMIDAFDKMVDSPNKQDDITHLINKKNYWKFDSKTIRDFLIKTNTNCFESNETIDKNPAQHPNEIGYNLISEELYNYIVGNNII